MPSVVATSVPNPNYALQPVLVDSGHSSQGTRKVHENQGCPGLCLAALAEAVVAPELWQAFAHWVSSGSKGEKRAGVSGTAGLMMPSAPSIPTCGRESCGISRNSCYRTRSQPLGILIVTVPSMYVGGLAPPYQQHYGLLNSRNYTPAPEVSAFPGVQWGLRRCLTSSQGCCQRPSSGCWCEARAGAWALQRDWVFSASAKRGL